MDRVIVVGVDGSPASQQALRWAVEEARVHKYTVQAVTTWPAQGLLMDAWRGLQDERHAEADRISRHEVDRVRRQLGDDVSIAREVVRGDPVDLLVRLSDHAAVLVVGTHATTSLRHAALGSVSEACIMSASCPVVVVPPTRSEPYPEDLEAVAPGRDGLT